MYEDHERERIEDARREVGALVTLMRINHTLWHRTSLASLRGILNGGGIQPNDGRFPVTYAHSTASFGRALRAVSLFDFNTSSVDDILLHAGKWLRFFSDCGPLTVFVRIDARKLAPAGLCKPESFTHQQMLRTRPDGTPYIPVYIPKVEAWYPGTIEVKAFTEYFAFQTNSRYHFERVLLESGTEKLAQLQATWTAEDLRLAAELLARKPTIGELIQRSASRHGTRKNEPSST